MRPEFEQIANTSTSSFIAKKVVRESRPLLTQAWHYHPEIELCYTLKSKGKRFVGNMSSRYSEGDLVLLGSNLPHGFITGDQTEQIVIQFKLDFLGTFFFENKELKRIKSMLTKASSGFYYGTKTQELTAPIINKIIAEEGLTKLIYLLELLKILSIATDCETICDKAYSVNLKLNQLSRVKMIFQYIEDNFQNDISIESACKVINLTESAFYKFIKKHTNKKFTTILNEYRIDYASKLLSKSDLTIAEVCYQSGFNNLSYFNRKFKEFTSLRPSEYRASIAFQ